MGAVVRFSPFAQFDGALDTAFDDLVRRAFPTSGATSWTPSADVYQLGDDLVVAVEIPGVDPAAIEVSVEGRALTIQGHRDLAGDGDQPVFRREIRRGEFSRMFRLPANVPVDNVLASYEDGILKVRISGAVERAQRRRVPVASVVNPVDALQPRRVEAATETLSPESGGHVPTDAPGGPQPGH